MSYTSGNTIKKGSFYKNHNQPIIIRSIKVPFYGLPCPEDDIIDTLDEHGLDDGNLHYGSHRINHEYLESVPYSLNKKKRWSIPQRIAGWILLQGKVFTGTEPRFDDGSVKYGGHMNYSLEYVLSLTH